MKNTLVCLILAGVLGARPAAAACEKPALVSVPDGAESTESELLAVQDQVEQYVAAMDLYIACENEAMTAGGTGSTATFLVLMNARIESTREEVDTVVKRFNDQVEAFRAARRTSLIPPR